MFQGHRSAFKNPSPGHRWPHGSQVSHKRGGTDRTSENCAEYGGINPAGEGRHVLHKHARTTALKGALACCCCHLAYRAHRSDVVVDCWFAPVCPRYGVSQPFCLDTFSARRPPGYFQGVAQMMSTQQRDVTAVSGTRRSTIVTGKAFSHDIE